MSKISSIFDLIPERKHEYNLQFDHEEDGCWYYHCPNWPFAHHNLMMVAGADDLCAYLSDDDKTANVSVIVSDKEELHAGYGELVKERSTLTGGATYHVNGLAGFNQKVWICPVTLTVLGCYPKYIYVKKIAK